MPDSQKFDQKWSVALCLFALACLTWEAWHIADWLRVVTLDASSCYLPWYGDLLRAGRFHGINGVYANYTPPTLYLFSLASLFHRPHSPIVLLKLINAPFLVAATALTYLIGRDLDSPRLRSGIVAASVAVLPEVWQNAFHWGQYDLIFTTFLLGMTLALLRGHAVSAMLLFGSALAFKLQAVFVAPALVALVFAGDLPVLSLLSIPAAYLIWMVPAAFAGRSWLDLLTIYLHQADTYPKLSMDAPNLYLMLQPYLPVSRLALATRVAEFIAVVACGCLMVALARGPGREQRRSALILALTMSQLLAAYFLPKMHERYYFAASVFATLLMLFRWEAAIPVLLLQVSALSTYHQYFRTAGYDTSRSLFFLPFLCLTAAVVKLFVAFIRLCRQSREAPWLRLRW